MENGHHKSDTSPSSTNGHGNVVDINQKREDYLSWADYFMSVAFLSAMRSKDPSSQVGACIVNDQNKIVGIGYNGMPLGCSDDEFPWCKNAPSPVDNKYMYVCHAEMNAILNKIVGKLANCSIYVALFPCNECAKLIIQAGIRQVFYFSDKNWSKDECVASRKMFDAAGVNYVKHVPSRKQIVIDFDAIDWNKDPQLPQTPAKAKEQPLL